MQTLKIGSKGNDVRTLQRILNLYADGIFGEITKEAVKKFQSENGLWADGVVGPKTWAKLITTNNGSLNLKKTTRSIKEIILHCSATPEGKKYTVADIKKWHKQRGFSDIGYHYVIYLDGSINEGRNINIVGAHCTGRNTGSIGICYVGGLDGSGKKAKDTRTPEQKSALVKLVKELMSMYNLTINNVHCHYEYANKACPSFKIEDFRKELLA